MQKLDPTFAPTYPKKSAEIEKFRFVGNLALIVSLCSVIFLKLFELRGDPKKSGLAFDRLSLLVE